MTTVRLRDLPPEIAGGEHLPTLPTIAVDVVRMTSDPDCCIEDLAQALARDPALSAKILKLANSSLFRRGFEITTLDKATMVLGMKTVMLMALSFSLADNLPRSNGKVAFDYVGYWRRSLTTAVAARSFARLLRARNGDEGFLCGLLANIGQLVLAECDPRYQQVLEAAGGDLPSATVERERLGFDHHEIGGALLRSWGLPRILVEPITWLGVPADELTSELNDDERALLELLDLASQASLVICHSSKGPALARLHELAQVKGLDENETDAFMVGLESGITETARLLNVDLKDSVSMQKILDQARMQMLEVSLDTAMNLHQTSDRAAKLERETEELRERAHTHNLTGIGNRAYFDAQLERAVEGRRAEGESAPFGILVLDIDHFKSFNDTHGHQVGDRVLAEVAGAVAAAARPGDVVARYGGEEFAVIAPATDGGALQSLAEAIRGAVEGLTIDVDGKSLRVTISVGGACSTDVTSVADGVDLLKIADECLYEAKRNGRNRCACREVASLKSNPAR